MNKTKFTQRDISLGKRIARMRRQRDLSQEEVAIKSSLSQTTVGLLEVGKRRISLRSLQRIASSLGVKVKDLINF
ncbi:helix-turn-helix transcriptional regulator [Candidatus Daviesbacteria bacterium]|nr:helix-turn-helix transcriptional regulator [Candidatus Daviesbacteria bacterium]